MLSLVRSAVVCTLWSAAIAPQLCSVPSVYGQGSHTVVIDARAPYHPPASARYDESGARSATGDVIGLNSRFLTLNDKPWFPVMGEFHYSRYPASKWEEEILKMKSAGVNIVSTYVIWIHHEEVEGRFDWSGQRDLRAFAQICQRHGMYLVVRIGPWAHGEVRNGGLPDWVVKRGNFRRNDPLYLRAVRAWYSQIGKQLSGMLWKEGGPVVGVQLENEYGLRGEGEGEAHILELKKLARAEGLDVPLYFVTAWDNAVVPQRAVLPVYDGYPAAPWARSVTGLPPAEVYAFRLRSRVAANLPVDGSTHQEVPFLTAEMGAGNEDTYHRRPVIAPEDVAAIIPVMLGSGVNLYGTYMFQGGENPDGKLTTLQESQETGYPNDVPVKSYDFQAPLGEFGQERPSFRKLKVFQYFLNDFGPELAPMTVVAPRCKPKSPADLSVVRAVARTRGDQGFLFVNNYVRGLHMPSRPATRFQIRLPGQNLLLPRHPVDIPSGSYFVWPFNFEIGSATLRYATAQLFTRLESEQSTTFFFVAQPGIPVEFALNETSGSVEHASSGTLTRSDGVTYISGVEPGLDSAVEVVSKTGIHVRLVTLTQQQAEDAWKLRIAGIDRLLITPQDFFWDADAASPRIWLRNRFGPSFDFTITPAPVAMPHGSLPIERSAHGLEFAKFTAFAQPVGWDVQCRQIQQAGTVPPVKMGPMASGASRRVATAPPESAFSEAAKWAIAVPGGATKDLSDVFLSIRYTGDEARLYEGGRMVTDNFYNGKMWNIGLSRFCNFAEACRLKLEVLPLPAHAPIYFDAGRAPAGNEIGQKAALLGARLAPEYQLVVDPR